MAYDIGPLRDDELEPLSRFLTSGFGSPPDALFAAPDVLRWKYLDASGLNANELLPRSLVARDAAGRIVGHVGWAPTSFLAHVRNAEKPVEFDAVHMIDWLGSPDHPGVGGALMRRVHSVAPIQYGLGGSAAGRRVINSAGYKPWPSVPVFKLVLRAGYAWRDPAASSQLHRLARACRDSYTVVSGAVARFFWRSPFHYASNGLRELAEGDWNRYQLSWPGGMYSSTHNQAQIERLLRFPRHQYIAVISAPPKSITSSIWFDSFVAVVGVLRNGPARIGKIIDLVLPTPNPDFWVRAYNSLVHQLRGMGADVALACGSTPWEAEALHKAGFRRAYDLDFRIRDRAGILDASAPFHVSFLDADYAYLP